MSARIKCSFAGLITMIALMTLSAPATGTTHRLRVVPLTKGSATISWAGRTGDSPTIRSIHGSVGGFAVVATGKIPTSHFSQSHPNRDTFALPIADVKGTIGGAPFTLEIAIKLPHIDPLSRTVDFGIVTGSLQGRPFRGVLSEHEPSRTVSFSGTIGTVHVTGTIPQIVRYGISSTASAHFVTTK